MSTPPIAACLGDNAVDVYLPPANRAFIGGNAVNTAIAMQAAGCPTAYLGAVSRDSYGQALLVALRQRGVDTSHAVETDAPTRRVYTHFLPGGEQRFAHELMQPRAPFNPPDSLLDFARGLRLVHLNWISDPLACLEALASPGGPLISLDFGPFYSEELLSQSLPRVDLAFLSRSGLDLAQGASLARDLYHRGPRMVVLLLGPQGSLLFDGNNLIHQPPVPTGVVDTLGAGDAYIGAFLAAYLRSQPLSGCALEAASAAAQACRVFGAWPGAELSL